MAALLLASSAHAGRGKNRIHAVDHGPADSGTSGSVTIRIRGTDRPTFAVYTLEGPSRVVVDISGASLDERITTAGGVMASWTLNEWSVTQVSAYQLQGQDGSDSAGNRSMVRVVVDLARPGTYHARTEGRDVVVTVMPRDPAPPRASPEEAARAAAAVREAEVRRRELIAAIEEAERRRDRAEQQRTQAEQQRAKVEGELREAEQKRARAEAAAAEAARRAEQARALREQEESAYGQASAARKEAERRNAEATRAGERLAALQATAREAQAQVEALRQSAAEAARRAAEVEERKNATERDIARARREAERLEKARAEAEAELGRRRGEVSRQEREAERLARARSEAEAELRKLDAAAGKARQARQEEEAKIAALSKQRQELEREVERIRERTRAVALAERETQRKQAEAELRELDTAAGQARQARQEEEARIAELSKRRQELEAQLARMNEQAASKARAEREAQQKQTEQQRKQAEAEQKQTEQQRKQAEAERKQAEAQRKQAEAQRKRAEAELRELDTAAGQARQARQEEEARIAELSKRRQELEAQLARMNEQAASKARAEREAQQKQTEQQRRQAEAEQKQTRTQQKQAEAQRKQAEAQQKQVEAQRTQAEADLRELDMAADKARQARQAEEARIAALSKQRQELETQLAQMREQTKASAPAKNAPATPPAAVLASAPAKNAPATAPAKGAPVAPIVTSDEALAQVRDVDFEDHSQIARVIIALSSDVEPRIVSSKGNRAILEINGAELPEKLQRTLDTRPYRGPIQAISSYRHPKDRSRMRVVVELAYPAKNALRRQGSTYYWDFAKPAPQRSESVASSAPEDENRARARSQSYPAPVVGGYGASSTPITRKTVAQLGGRDRKVYRGTKIDLDLKDVDIHNVMRLLADVGGINIVIPDDVRAQVTVRLRQVPWDQALEVVLASKGLWYRREGNLYRIAPRKQLDSEDQAEAERLANLVKAEAPEPQIFTLNYAVAKDIKGQLEPLLSPKGRIEVDERTNSLIINDIRAHRRRIIDLLTRLDTQTPQIQIEARIVEARSTFVRDIGVQWGGRSSSNTGLVFPNFIDVAGGNVDQQTNFSGVYTPAASPDFAVNLPAAVGTGAGGAVGIFLRSLGGDALTLRLSALEDSGSVRIISAPKITVLNNVEAEISQGVSIPISVISANGVQTQFVPADLSLKVTPHVSQRDCSIAMDLEVAKNEADFVNTGARGDPTILRKEAKTTVLVADNETTVIGGIYTRNSGLSYRKIPFFGDLPLVGWLFKNRRENDERTEVLVFITPRITNKAFLRCE